MQIQKDEYGLFWLIEQDEVKAELFKRCDDETVEEMQEKGFSLFCSNPEELWIQNEQMTSALGSQG